MLLLLRVLSEVSSGSRVQVPVGSVLEDLNEGVDLDVVQDVVVGVSDVVVVVGVVVGSCRVVETLLDVLVEVREVG